MYTSQYYNLTKVDRFLRNGKVALFVGAAKQARVLHKVAVALDIALIAFHELPKTLRFGAFSDFLN